MSKHTMGEWRVNPHNAESVLICPGYSWGWEYLPHQHEQYGINPEADARLVAAAPELLKALREVIADLEREGTDGWMTGCVHSEEWQRARAAIARATGEQA